MYSIVVINFNENEVETLLDIANNIETIFIDRCGNGLFFKVDSYKQYKKLFIQLKNKISSRIDIMIIDGILEPNIQTKYIDFDIFNYYSNKVELDSYIWHICCKMIAEGEDIIDIRYDIDFENLDIEIECVNKIIKDFHKIEDILNADPS